MMAASVVVRNVWCAETLFDQVTQTSIVAGAGNEWLEMGAEHCWHAEARA
jgi:hypothetical protein